MRMRLCNLLSGDRASFHCKLQSTTFVMFAVRFELLEICTETMSFTYIQERCFPDLGGASAEASAVEDVMANTCRDAHHCQPSADAGIRLMSCDDMFHCAGHAVSESASPA